MSKHLSIIVPVYNESKCILPFLKHIKTQASVKHEIIVVDGESSDETVSLRKNYRNSS